MLDMESFSVGGYSMGGGASHDAALIDNSIAAVLSLNPTVLFEDCDLCAAENYDGEIFCICLVPELINHQSLLLFLLVRLSLMNYQHTKDC